MQDCRPNPRETRPQYAGPSTERKRQFTHVIHVISKEIRRGGKSSPSNIVEKDDTNHAYESQLSETGGHC